MKSKIIPVVCCVAVLASMAMLSANKLTDKDDPIAAYAETIDEPSTCALTRLDISISYTSDEKIRATLKNTFTLFSSTVNVGVYLYSSTVKTTDISEMTLEASAYSSDLNMYDYIYAESSTHNEDRYWVGYAIYFKNNSKKKTYQTEPVFYYADGTYNPAY